MGEASHLTVNESLLVTGRNKVKPYSEMVVVGIQVLTILAFS